MRTKGLDERFYKLAEKRIELHIEPTKGELEKLYLEGEEVGDSVIDTAIESILIKIFGPRSNDKYFNERRRLKGLELEAAFKFHKVVLEYDLEIRKLREEYRQKMENSR